MNHPASSAIVTALVLAAANALSQSALPRNVVRVDGHEIVFGDPFPLTQLNSPAIDDSSSITADGLNYYFDSDRPGGLGDGDIWVSTRPSTAAPWEPARNLGAEFSFADGHVEHHRWRSPKEWHPGPIQPGGDREDYQWLMAGMPRSD